MTLDGPFSVLDADGNPKPGVHYNTTADDVAAHPELAAYVVEPEPLARVWAGDDPLNPRWTVALRFPDQATADSVLAAINPPPV